MEDPNSPTLLLATSLFTIIQGQWPILLMGFLGVAILLFLSALTSGSEVAFFSLSPAEVETLDESRNKKEQAIARLLETPRRLLANILVLNNFINVAIVMVSTYLTWSLTGHIEEQGVLVFALSMAVTFLIVFFGEITPKVFANNQQVGFLKYSLWLILFADKAFYPLTFLLMRSSYLVEKAVHREGQPKPIGVDELNQALELTTGKETTNEEKDILKGIVNFGTISVVQIMRSRVDITAFDLDWDFHELMDRINKSGYSRVPVYLDTIDHVEGVLHIKDLLPYVDKEEEFKWKDFVRPAFFVPENKKIDDLLRDFQHKHIHMAIVVDEYGGTSGLVTFEDVVEQIVGEFQDENDDDDDISFTQVDKNTYVFEGKTLITDFCRVLDTEINTFDEVRGESQSLGGMLIEHYAKLPQVGDKLTIAPFLFTVSSVNNRRVKKIRVHVQEKRIHE